MPTDQFYNMQKMLDVVDEIADTARKLYAANPKSKFTAAYREPPVKPEPKSFFWRRKLQNEEESQNYNL